MDGNKPPEVDVCPECGGAGIRIIKRSDGKDAAVECDCVLGRIADDYERRLNEAAETPIAAATLEDFRIDSPSHQTALDDARDILAKLKLAGRYRLERPAPGASQVKRGLYLHGDISLGKSFLAVAVARAAIRENHRVEFVTAREVVNGLNERVKDQRAVTAYMAEVSYCDLLVLDDAGAVREIKAEGVVKDALYSFFADYYGKARPYALVVTSNEKPDEVMSKYFADRNDRRRIYSRLKAAMHFVELKRNGG